MGFTISPYRNGKPVHVGKCEPDKKALRVPVSAGVHECAVIPVRDGKSKLVTVRVAAHQASIVVITSNAGHSFARGAGP